MLQKLDLYFVDYISKLTDIINSHGVDWNNYTLVEQQEIYKCVQIAHTIKSILDTSLLKENGELDEATHKILEEGNRYLQMLQKI